MIYRKKYKILSSLLLKDSPNFLKNKQLKNFELSNYFFLRNFNVLNFAHHRPIYQDNFSNEAWLVAKLSQVAKKEGKKESKTYGMT